MTITKNKFRKGLVMATITTAKPTALKLLTIFVVALVAGNLALADSNSTDPENVEVLTTLEQRMLEKISIDFRSTPIEDVLRIMAEQANVDIIKSPSVVGNVTATLTDVPLEEALHNILAAHGYGYVTDKNMIRISPMAEITARTENLVNRIYRVNYADVSEVEKALKKFISARGSLSSNTGTSNIIITDSESKIKAIDTFMEEIDRITPQILVEARIYDITTKDRLDLGVSWLAGTNTTLSDTLGASTGTKLTPLVSGTFNSTVNEATGSSNTFRFGILGTKIDLDTILKAEQENICATLLANPRILVLDNERAFFKSISEIPYQQITESSEGGSSVGTTQFREVGVQLTVIPHLTRDGMIRLRIQPLFNVATGAVSVGGYEILSSQPIVDTRTADTTLVVKDGQTIVLGGLRKKEISQQTNKVPLLGDLPLVGMLFRFEGEETVINELVVFITPRVIAQPALSATEQQQHIQASQWCEPGACPTRLTGCD